MSNYKSTFGVEIHLELNTNTKAFSSSPVSTTMEPNTAISPTDLAYPGTKPRLNKKVVEHAFKLATLLKMDIADVLHFDRKNYIYPDLSKGFQITQFYNPIGKKGIFTIINQDGVKKEIQITEIHIEEDTAKQVKLSGGKIGFDFNRAGVALIEIVTGHEDFETIEEVTQFVEQFRQLALLLNISNCKFEDGSIRTDINVSVSNTTELGNRVEIKNLNSISNMRDALKFEIDSQIKTIESGSTVEVVTKRFDEATRQTVFMRNKESITDYNYFPEANILPINIVSFKEQWSKDILINSISERQTLENENVNFEDINILLSNVQLFNLYKELGISSIAFIKNLLMGTLKDASLTLSNLSLKLEDYKNIISLLKDSKMTSTEAKVLIINSAKESVTDEIAKLSSREALTIEDLKLLIIEIDNENPELKDERPVRKLKFVMGQLMKKTKGAINAKEAMELLKEHYEIT